MEKGLLICGLLCLVIFYLPVKTGGVWNIGNQTGMVVGAVLYLSGMFYKRMEEEILVLWQSVYGKALLLVTGGCLLLIVLIALLETICILLAVSRRPATEGTIVVLGCKLYDDQPSKTLAGRLMAACHYMTLHPELVCIVSGGQGDDEPIAEARSMARFLIEKGIAPERIYQEDQSRSTRENLALSAQIIEKNQLNPHMIIVTSGFHQYRASVQAKRLGFSYSSLSGATPWWLLPTFYVRELYGILYLFLTGFISK